MWRHHLLALYNAGLVASRLALPLLAPWHDKLRRGMAGRRGALSRLAALGPQLRGRVVWLHSTSVGEYEQARPLAARLVELRPEVEILHTFFSPSGYDYATRLGEARHFDYLPLDTPGDMARLLEALQPRLLVFVKFDLWPNLIVQASRQRVPLFLVDATLQPGSLRSRWPALGLYRELYRRLDGISAVSAADAARFRALVPDHECIVVDGDTRFDQVLRRRAAAARASIPAALQRTPRPFTLLAGSTWDADEGAIVTAWSRFRATSSQPARLLLVPHEPTPQHLRAVERRLAAAGLGATRLAEIENGAVEVPEDDVILVDRVGVLAELYAHADLAYVGGAFGRGVHNLIEPASMGLPVFFGPRHHNAPEAEMLLEAGAASVIRSAVDLEQRLRELAGDEDERRRRGGRARAFVDAHLGATERCLQRLLAALDAPSTAIRETR